MPDRSSPLKKSPALGSPLEELYAQDLDSVECSNPNCKGDHPLFIGQRCHLGAGLDVSYEGDVLTMRCHECQQFIMRVRVARAPTQ
jgi:hypothetical protein